MMKHRLTALALAGVISLGALAGCGSKDKDPENTTTPPPTATVEPTVTPTPSVDPTQTPAPTDTPDPSQTPENTDKPSGGSTTPSKDPSPSKNPTPAPSSKPATSVVNAVWEGLSALEMPALDKADADILNAYYGIDAAADLDEFILALPMMNTQATEFFIAKVKDGKMDAVKAAVESRKAALIQQWSKYLPEQLELVENAKLVTDGNYLFFAISYDVDKTVSVFQSCVK